MKKHALIILLALTLFESSAYTATLPATEDSYGYRAKLSLSANKATTLPVDATHRAFIYFDLNSSLPPGTRIRYARLRLFTPSVTRSGNGLSLHAITGQWNESLAGSEPTFDTSTLATITPASLGAKRFISMDVSATVQSWITTPASNEGFAITAVPGATAKLTASVTIGAKEGTGSGYPAELDIEIANDPVASGTIGSAELATGAVQSANLATGAVVSGALAEGSVTTTKLAAGAVTDEKITSVAGAKINGYVSNATTATTALTSTTVSGFAASATPAPNTLLPLDSNGKFPSSVFPPATGTTLALGSSDPVPTGYIDSGGRIANWQLKVAAHYGPTLNNDGVLSVIGTRVFMAWRGYVREFDTTTNDWNVPETQIAPLGAVTAVGPNGLVYFFGGVSGNQSMPTKTVLSYNPISGTTTRLADMPSATIPSRVAYLNGHFYFLSHNNCLNYNIAIEQWTTFPLPPEDSAEIISVISNGITLFALTANGELLKIIPDQTPWTSIKTPGVGSYYPVRLDGSDLLLIGSGASHGTVLKYRDVDREFLPQASLPLNTDDSPLTVGRITDEVIIFSQNSQQIVRAPLSSFRSLYIKSP